MDHPEPKADFSAFAPTCLLGVSLVILLGWNLYAMTVQRGVASRALEQQMLQLAQAAQVEEKLKVMMSDLLVLAVDDADARAIVQKYNIKSSVPVAPEKGPDKTAK